MGGNALKTVKTTRKSAEDYERIKAHILQTLEDKLGLTGIKWRVPHEAPCKESYGDLDVLITRQSEFDIREWILLTFKPDELVGNGGIYSFNIPGFPLAKDFQIDFITTSAEQFEIHHFFLSWGDCGMLIGQIARALGFQTGHMVNNLDSQACSELKVAPNPINYTVRFGQQGLFICYSERSGMSDDLILSTEPKQICEFLGLDYVSWSHGFEDEDALFRWVCLSPYINLVDFKTTKSTREMYTRFVKFVKIYLNVPDQMDPVSSHDRWCPLPLLDTKIPAQMTMIPSQCAKMLPYKIRIPSQMDKIRIPSQMGKIRIPSQMGKISRHTEIPVLDTESPALNTEIPVLDAIITYFGKQSEFAAIQQKQADAVKRSEKFGAHLFSALGNIPGKELGQIIAGFKREIPGDFKAWVLATDEAEIQQTVSEYLTETGLIPV